MILKELQDFVLDYHRVSLAEMELHFHMDGDALRQMLLKLIKKGRVRKLPIPDKCHGCTFCNPDTIEFYEWVDRDQPDTPHLAKSSLTKAQIHSIHAPMDELTASDSPEIKYAVILHNYDKTKEEEG
ncbi:MAG: FeoC-like transcriptional regulator [Xenococcaceae cyanobacterium MO_167.B27]|nr:FeoC-like transcriptional regulator [Xenococcaceae cyanobacterium MO_167.B27]